MVYASVDYKLMIIISCFSIKIGCFPREDFIPPYVCHFFVCGLPPGEGKVSGLFLWDEV